MICQDCYLRKNNYKMIKFKEFLFESAPRIPNDIEYWKNKGKTGKDVCIIFHDDMDGIVSAIMMKNWLENKGFTIKTYAIINYQESWDALNLDTKLINIALDYAEDSEDVDIYMDHHGSFDDDVRLTQKKHSVKTSTGSAAEGIALQLGVPFSSEIKNWIDMIDSAKYQEYKVNISDILNFDLKLISKDPNSKMRFSAAFNQMLKRSDFKTFIEVVNAAKSGVSIFNIFRLFKIFFPKNNPNWKSGSEAEFVDDGELRLKTMQDRTRGKSSRPKTVYMSQMKFKHDFSGSVRDSDNYRNQGEKMSVGTYQIIGNLMFVPSGTWANALRAKAIFVDDIKSGIIPSGNDKLNFTLLQYGNTLQIADLDTRMEDMKDDDLPILKNGDKVSNLGKYMSGLVENFRKHLGYPSEKEDSRLKSGGHYGIGTISNIFGTCKVKPYEGIPYLDMFKNKVINDISGVKWTLSMPWNDKISIPVISDEQINQRMIGKDEIRTEKDAIQEKKERRYLSFVYQEQDYRNVNSSDFKIDSLKKIYNYLENFEDSFVDLGSALTPSNISRIWFKDKGRDDANMKIFGIPWIMIFDNLSRYFDLDIVYDSKATEVRKSTRKEAKRLLTLIGAIVRGDYIKDDFEKFEKEYEKWKSKNI